jgi:hypothetical protein
MFRANASSETATGGIVTRYLGKTFAVALALALGGCQSMEDFSDWSAGYDKAVEASQNENMLINMVRAAYNRPLHFTAISVVRGNGQASPSLGLTGQFPFANPFKGGGIGAGPSLAVSGGFNFDMASLDNAEFMGGLVTPIAPSTVNSYVNQGIPRELLFNLLIQKVTISDGTRTDTYVNDPTRADYQNFQITLKNLLDLGLTTETASDVLPFGPSLSAAEMKNPQVLQVLSQAIAAGAMVQQNGPDAYQMAKPVSQARFCFMGGGPSMPKLPTSALCSAIAQSAKTSAEASTSGEHQFATGSSIGDFRNASMTVTVRSTRDVFNYLGNLIYMQVASGKPIHLEMQTQEAKDFNYLKRGDDLLVVVKNRPRSDDIVKIDYEGNTYSIPSENQGNSALVFTIVSQILMLSKTVNLIPASTAVEIH